MSIQNPLAGRALPPAASFAADAKEHRRTRSSERRLILAYPYGVIEARLSRDELENKRIRFDDCAPSCRAGWTSTIPEWPNCLAGHQAGFFQGRQAVSRSPRRAALAELAGQHRPPAESDTRAKLLYRFGETECNDENTRRKSQAHPGPQDQFPADVRTGGRFGHGSAAPVAHRARGG